MTDHPITGAVLVVGGGIAGIQASLDLAEMGAEVFLLDEAPSIGGRMAKLDKTFPTNDCALCILSPKLVDAGGHPRIKLLTNSSLLDVMGTAGEFTARVLRRPRYVSLEKCTGCGICVQKCPVKVKDPFNQMLCETKAIRVPFPQAIPLAAVIDEKACLMLTKKRCGICRKACDAGAVDYEQKPEEVELKVGSVILAAGSNEFDPALRREFGYGRFENVVTSLEFERMLCASGPSGGHLRRPSDGKEPKRIAFLQCVGSRDRVAGSPACSAMCCMQAVKEAVVAAEHVPGLSASIFGIDLRAQGKHFDAFVERAEREHGVRFLRSRATGLKRDGDKNLVVRYVGQNEEVIAETFDLVVLSVGFAASERTRALAKKIGIALDETSFCRAVPFSGVASSREGIFACGTSAGPKDIPEAVAEASAAAMAAAGYALASGSRSSPALTFPPERSTAGEPPRIGVYVCHCGINIASVVRVGDVAGSAKALPNVVRSEELVYACSQDAIKRIESEIREHDLNRVIVASCSPRTHEPLFKRMMRRAGLNPNLFEMANIRDHCSWVHRDDPEAATAKAAELVGMAVAKAARLVPLPENRIEVGEGALVIGGGAAGLTAALELARAGRAVHLVEKEKELGGNARRFQGEIEGGDVRAFLSRLIDEVENEKRIRVHREASLKKVSGHIGNFSSEIASSSGETATVGHGVILLATGAAEDLPPVYGLSENPDVVTARQFEHMLFVSHPLLKRASRIVFIACAGQREEKRPSCSRLCCDQAMKNAIAFKKESRTREVFFLYRDIRAYGRKELRYGLARDLGVNFIRYDLSRPPRVERKWEDTLVSAFDPILGEEVVIRADLVVLSTPIVGPVENREMAKLLKVPLDAENYFLEAHVKLRPVDFATDGIFLCGLAHGPKTLEESVVQARAAAGRAMTILTQKAVEGVSTIALVHSARCVSCGLCVAACPYRAIEIDEEKETAVVDEALCKGCGTCAAACLSAAIDLKGFSHEQIGAALEALAAD
jgi:heterodisulfide reductase subunit A